MSAAATLSGIQETRVEYIQSTYPARVLRPSRQVVAPGSIGVWVIHMRTAPAASQYGAASQAGASFMRADALALPLRDASADLLIDRGCFHYVGAADRARYAREARRELRRGGRADLVKPAYSPYG